MTLPARRAKRSWRSLERLRERLAGRLEREPDVLVAYLFGSVARGTSGSLSDVDVAVLLREGADTASRQLALAADLAEIAGSVDLTILNDAPIALAYRVLRDGRVIMCRDERARVEYWAHTVDRYLDMEPFRRTLAEGLRHRLEEGRFGRS